MFQLTRISPRATSASLRPSHTHTSRFAERECDAHVHRLLRAASSSSPITLSLFISSASNVVPNDICVGVHLCGTWLLRPFRGCSNMVSCGVSLRQILIWYYSLSTAASYPHQATIGCRGQCSALHSSSHASNQLSPPYLYARIIAVDAGLWNRGSLGKLIHLSSTSCPFLQCVLYDSRCHGSAISHTILCGYAWLFSWAEMRRYHAVIEPWRKVEIVSFSLVGCGRENYIRCAMDHVSIFERQRCTFSSQRA